MGKMNLLKANWEGKVGETVGAKWKDKKTIRTFTKPSNPNTQAQQNVRGAFSSITSFVALFADQIRYLTALDTSSMSVRNAIIKVNKAMISGNDFTKANLLISKGGLQKPASVSATQSSGVITVSWGDVSATNFTENAQMILVAVQEDSGIVEVVTEAYDTKTKAFASTFATGDVDIYAYYLDKRGSNKVGSESVYSSVTIA